MLLEEEVSATWSPILPPSFECTGDLRRNSCYIDYNEVSLYTFSYFLEVQ